MYNSDGVPTSGCSVLLFVLSVVCFIVACVILVGMING